jgi:molecular chaperone GrpE (heat shock protein)
MFPPEDNQRPESGAADAGKDRTDVPPEEISADADPLLDDWKTALHAELESWIEQLDEIPDSEAEDQPPDEPDLYSFYAQWIAANAESKKNNRRTAEAFGQWNEALGRCESDLKLLREQSQRLSAEAPSGAMSRAHCLVLVELLDRLERLGAAFAAPPQSPWWKAGSGWRQAWERQRQAFEILLDHFTAILTKEGVTRMETTGQPFDSLSMTAVAAEPDESRPDQTVLEEIAPGYRLRGELLRPAQVKVSQNKSKTIT